MERKAQQSPWRIRRPEAGDQEVVEAVVAEAFSRYLPRMDRKPFPMLDDYGAHIRAGRAFVLEEGEGAAGAGNGAIRGCLVLLPGEPGEMWLDVVAVSGGLQGRGYGRALVDFALRHAKALGCPRLKLYTNEVMVEAQAFYTRLGFTETHRALDAGYRRVFYVRREVEGESPKHNDKHR